MTLLDSPRIRRRRLAALALAVVLVVLAAATSTAAGSMAPQATSAHFLLRKGVLRPLDDPPGSARTGHFGVNNRGETVGAYGDAAGTGTVFSATSEAASRR